MLSYDRACEDSLQVQLPLDWKVTEFRVGVSDENVTIVHPDGTVSRFSIDDLRRFEVITTQYGPFLPDVFWMLDTTSGHYVIPQGATGDSELLNRLTRMNGFDSEKFAAAMGSTDDARFVCWTGQSDHSD